MGRHCNANESQLKLDSLFEPHMALIVVLQMDCESIFTAYSNHKFRPLPDLQGQLIQLHYKLYYFDSSLASLMGRMGNTIPHNAKVVWKALHLSENDIFDMEQ